MKNFIPAVLVLALTILSQNLFAQDTESYTKVANRLVELIKPKQGEEKFREMPWRTSLWQARVEAAKTGKPVLAFLMAGAPLAEPIIARQSPSERSVWTCGWSAPGIGSRTGSAPVASRRRS